MATKNPDLHYPRSITKYLQSNFLTSTILTQLNFKLPPNLTCTVELQHNNILSTQHWQSSVNPLPFCPPAFPFLFSPAQEWSGKGWRQVWGDLEAVEGKGQAGSPPPLSRQGLCGAAWHGEPQRPAGLAPSPPGWGTGWPCPPPAQYTVYRLLHAVW